MNEVKETVARFCDAWNRHDAEALAAMWREDGELHHPWGVHAAGRAAIRELLEKEHAASMAASRMTVRDIVTRSEDGNVIADIETVLTGVRAPNGKPYELQPTLCAMFVRTGSAWEIRTMAPVANPRSATRR
jgi:uncharacterized protein (TIGR02246 family)